MVLPALSVSPSPTRARLLFLVDDDQRTARRFASMLEEDGFAVEVLRDGAEAIERLAREPAPDAIVTDLVMPRASGIAVLGEARRRWRSIPVLFVTGHPDLLERPSIPFDPSPIVFTKPISYPEFSARLRELLGTSK
jgi:two-component system OmpR family response regulator